METLVSLEFGEADAVTFGNRDGYTGLPTITLEPPPKPVRWTRVTERGIAGMAPEPEPVWISNAVNVSASLDQETIVYSRSGVSCFDGVEAWPLGGGGGGAIVQTAASDLKTAQVSKLIRIARDWTKQAEEASRYRTDHAVEDGVVILNPAPTVSFEAAYTQYLLSGFHRLVPRDDSGERGWFTLWRLRAARAFLRGASAHAIISFLRGRLLELRAELARTRVALPGGTASQLIRLAYCLAPNAPPAHLHAQVYA